MLWNLSYRLRKAFRWLWLQEGSPAFLARGLSIGVFCGCFPLFGLQTLLGITLASLLRGNRLLAASGTWISNPFTYIPLYWLNYQIGSALFDQGGNQYDFKQFGWQEMWGQGWSFCSRLLLGSTLLGSLLGLLIGLLGYIILRFRLPRIR